MTPSVFVCVHKHLGAREWLPACCALAGDRIEGALGRYAACRPDQPRCRRSVAESGSTSLRPPKVLTRSRSSNDVVITMGCGGLYHYFPRVSYRDWKLDDPAGQPVGWSAESAFDIADRVTALVEELAPR